MMLVYSQSTFLFEAHSSPMCVFGVPPFPDWSAPTLYHCVRISHPSFPRIPTTFSSELYPVCSLFAMTSASMSSHVTNCSCAPVWFRDGFDFFGRFRPRSFLSAEYANQLRIFVLVFTTLRNSESSPISQIFQVLDISPDSPNRTSTPWSPCIAYAIMSS